MTDIDVRESLRARLGQRARTGTVAVVRRSYRGENSAILVLVVVVSIAIFAVILRDTDYMSADNLLSITRQTAAITVMAVPTVLVICSGEIDLSFAAVAPVAAFITALQLRHQSILVSVLAGLLFGALVGLVNGLITVFFRIPSFVVTLGMMGFLIGLGELITNSQSVVVAQPQFLTIFGVGEVFGVPALLLWSLAAVLIGQVILAYTPVGRAVLATGANVNAARFSGVRTNRIKVGVMVASGVGGAFAGLLYMGQFAAASYTLANTDLLTVIAAVIIGGAALSGGKGSVVGALVGSLLIGTLNNGLIIVGLANPEQLMARGIIIIAAVIFSARNSTGGGRRSRVAPRSDGPRPPAPDAPAATAHPTAVS